MLKYLGIFFFHIIFKEELLEPYFEHTSKPQKLAGLLLFITI